MPDQRITPATDRECKEAIRLYREQLKIPVQCPFCDDGTTKSINKFGVHCVGRHKMNDEKLMKALDGNHPALLSRLLEFRRLSRIANAAKAALYRKEHGIGPRGKNLPAKINQVAEIHIPESEEEVKQSLEELTQQQARAVKTLQSAAAMVHFATLIEKYGPEQIGVLLNGIGVMDKLPRR